jgi:hypothetical protein
MQSSHLNATAMPTAISSFVLLSSALAANAAWAMLENAFMTSGCAATQIPEQRRKVLGGLWPIIHRAISEH